MSERTTGEQNAAPPTVSIGVSAGSEVACCAVLTTASDGTETFDYRTITSDGGRVDTGEMVATSLDLAAEHLLDPSDSASTLHPQRHIAVAYRAEGRSRSILTAARRRGLALESADLLSETDAALWWLRHTGEVARYSTVAIVDIGAAGTSVSVVDQVDGTEFSSIRTDAVGGVALDRSLLASLSPRLPAAKASDRVLLAARLRTAKEQLSLRDRVTVDLAGDDTLTVTRAEFDTAAANAAAALGAAVRHAVAASGRTPDAVAVVGGGAHVPVLIAAVRRAVPATLIVADEPDSAVAKGAALAARASARPIPGSVPTSGAAVGVGVRTVGLVAAACTAMAVVLAYGVQALVPERSGDVSPTSSDVTVMDVPSPPAPTAPELTGGWGEAGDWTATRGPAEPPEVRTWSTPGRSPEASTPTWTPPALPVAPSTSDVAPEPAEPTPSLRPAPDLPTIVLPPLPTVPPWFPELPEGPPVGETPIPETTTDPATPGEGTTPQPSEPALPSSSEPLPGVAPTPTTSAEESTDGAIDGAASRSAPTPTG